MAKNVSKGSGRRIPKVEIMLDPSPEQCKELLATLKDRFNTNMNRHDGLEWPKIQVKLEAQPEKLSSLNAMESTWGEPDVVGYDYATDQYTFVDCSTESPQGRRYICFDGDGQKEREKKGIHLAGNAVDSADAMGIKLISEVQYRKLQELGVFDVKTSSWIQTPEDIRRRGGALFCDRRFGHVFVYHNGASSFYSARGFRGVLEV